MKWSLFISLGITDDPDVKEKVLRNIESFL